MSKFQNSDKEKLMAKYLLGELSENERSLVEERVFDDDDYFAELLAVEDDLTTKYLSGELSSQEFAKFEQHFLASPKRRERVSMADALNRTIKKLPVEPTSEPTMRKTAPNKPRNILDYIFVNKNAQRLAFAAAALAIVCAASWLWWQRNLLSEEISRLEQERAALREQKKESEQQINDDQQRNRQLADELQTERAHRSESEEQIIELQRENERFKKLRRENERVEPQKSNPEQTRPSIITFLLTPGLARDFGEEKTLRLLSSARTVVFNLNLQQDEYPNYQVSLQTAEGREVWRREDLKARRTRSGSILAFPVSARLLRGGVYILTLNGKTASDQSELINQYAFNVVVK